MKNTRSTHSYTLFQTLSLLVYLLENHKILQDSRLLPSNKFQPVEESSLERIYCSVFLALLFSLIDVTKHKNTCYIS